MAFLLLGAWALPAQMIDQNRNGMSDIWELLHGAAGADPLADSDGDGFSNLQEALAGTNPFDSNSYPRIAYVGATNGVFNATIAGSLGKLYQLQSTDGLAGSNWQVETNLI